MGFGHHPGAGHRSVRAGMDPYGDCAKRGGLSGDRGCGCHQSAVGAYRTSERDRRRKTADPDTAHAGNGPPGGRYGASGTVRHGRTEEGQAQESLADGGQAQEPLAEAGQAQGNQAEAGQAQEGQAEGAQAQN